MKNLQNWLIAAVAIVIVVIGGYFVINSNNSQTAKSPTTTNQEQVKAVEIKVTVDYAGDAKKEAETKSVDFQEGQTAWDYLKLAVGEENVEYKDYGGNLGIFIQSINEVKPSGNKFWLFKVNGDGAKVGASSYIVKEGDKIEFVISEPSGGQ